MKIFQFISGGVLGFVVASLHAQQPVTSGPLVREGVTEKLSEHVYVIPDNNVGGVPNVGFVVGTRATLIVDTGMGKQNGETVLREAQKINSTNALYLVTTHIHPEHDLGAHAFPSTTKMIRPRAQVDEIETSGMATANAFRSRSPQMAQLLEGAKFRKADEVFEKEKVVDLGGVEVRLLALGPNHTPGDLAILVKDDAVLFSGDIAMKGAPSFVGTTSNLNNWLKSLDKLDELKPRIVVPSHGPIGDAKFIADYREYLTTIRARTVALKKEGKSVEQAVETLNEELKEKYPTAGGRLAGAVRAAYREAP
jgi:glyoxylase-like metal-dependent hydrolase (beta-lactamase superfamily II)